MEIERRAYLLARSSDRAFRAVLALARDVLAAHDPSTCSGMFPFCCACECVRNEALPDLSATHNRDDAAYALADVFFHPGAERWSLALARAEQEERKAHASDMAETRWVLAVLARRYVRLLETRRGRAWYRVRDRLSRVGPVVF